MYIHHRIKILFPIPDSQSHSIPIPIPFPDTHNIWSSQVQVMHPVQSELKHLVGSLRRSRDVLDRGARLNPLPPDVDASHSNSASAQSGQC